MKKIKYLLLIAIISFFVLPSSISAACGTPASPEYVVSNGDYFLNEEILFRGNTYEFNALVKNNPSCSNIQSEYIFLFDEKKFEFEGFESNYGFKYIDGKIKLVDKSKLNKGDNSHLDIYYIDDEGSNLVNLYTIKLKLKEDAKLGETMLNHEKYNICISYGHTDGISCGEEANNNDEIIKPDNNKNDNAIENENNDNQENNVTDKVILDNTKFYVLAGLLGTVVIEMFVLILKKTKKV